MSDHNLLAEYPRYEKVQELGRGSFGTVYLAKNTENQQLVAIKFLRKRDVNKYVEAEIVNHSLLRHPHIIQFKEVFLTSNYICIAMEYASGGSLFKYVQTQGRLKESAARWFFQQVIIATDYCHRCGVANRDVKLENTLLQVVKTLPLPLVKLCDFGYSKADFSSAPKSTVGTVTYMAPEVLGNTDGKYDGKIADIWSCGVMLYVMVVGRYPFDTPSGSDIPKPHEVKQLLDNMKSQTYQMPSTVDLSADGKALLKRLLQPVPEKRITIKEIYDDPWFCINIPPGAQSMNDTYLKAGPPPGYQKPEDIKKMLEDMKQQLSSSGKH